MKKMRLIRVLLIFLLGLVLSLILPQSVLAHGEKASEAALIAENVVLLVHIITAVFMAWPLYALITVNERPVVGAPLGDKVDDFIEGIIKKNSRRCYIFQLTALVTGLYLVGTHYESFSVLLTNWRLFGKLLGLFSLMGLLSYVVYSLQPRIDTLFMKLKKKDKSKEKIAAQISRLRLQRKKFATACLTILLAVILLAVQINNPLPLLVNAILLGLFALFAYRVYKANIPYGWV
jgi:hypothetical protein